MRSGSNSSTSTTSTTASMIMFQNQFLRRPEVDQTKTTLELDGSKLGTLLLTSTDYYRSSIAKVGSTGEARAAAMMTYLPKYLGAPNPENKTAKDLFAEIVGSLTGKEPKAVDLGNSKEFRITLADAIAVYFKENKAEIVKASSKNFEILLTAFLSYYETVVEASNSYYAKFAGKDYSGIYTALDVLLKASRLPQVYSLPALAELQELAVESDAFRNVLIAQIFAHIKSTLTSLPPKSITHKLFLEALVSFYENDRYYLPAIGVKKDNVGIYRALNILKLLESKNENELIKGLIDLHEATIIHDTSGSIDQGPLGNSVDLKNKLDEVVRTVLEVNDNVVMERKRETQAQENSAISGQYASTNFVTIAVNKSYVKLLNEYLLYRIGVAERPVLSKPPVFELQTISGGVEIDDFTIEEGTAMRAYPSSSPSR